jgi:hypothetical protein
VFIGFVKNIFIIMERLAQNDPISKKFYTRTISSLIKWRLRERKRFSKKKNLINTSPFYRAMKKDPMVNHVMSMSTVYRYWKNSILKFFSTIPIIYNKIHFINLKASCKCFDKTILSIKKHIVMFNLLY